MLCVDVVFYRCCVVSRIVNFHVVRSALQISMCLLGIFLLLIERAEILDISYLSGYWSSWFCPKAPTGHFA